MGYFIAVHGVQQGPFELNELPAEGLRADSLVWTEGMAEWKRADSVPELVLLIRSAGSTVAPSAAPPSPGLMPLGTPQMMNYQTPIFSPTNGMAVASMVLGIVAFPMSIVYCVGFIPAILAIVFGFIARGRIKRGETTQGAGMALAGIILGFVQLSLVAILILLFAIGIGVAAVSQPGMRLK